MIGSTLGPYRVISKVGEGGMGIVYRATDINLGRDVAIKMLPPAVADDPDRLARFEREARLLASLNHPNIASVFGVEQGALVMEMIDGPTIADRLRVQPFSLEETIEIAVQVADALEAAHEKGIVHRDLKPANIKLTSNGLVKVLDFGLAKAFVDEVSSDPANTPTVTAAFSRTGIIMGTAAYMSPEQARGGHVDQRTDIWAFGLVLYEMLSRRQMFGGETIADSLAGVLKSPIDFNELPAETPAAIRRLLKRCLERDRRKRLRDIGDARLELLTASEEEPAPAAATPAAAPQKRSWLPWAAAAFCLVAAVTLAGWTFLRPQPRPPHAVRFSVPPAAGSKFIGAPSLSPDGRWVAFQQNPLNTSMTSGQLFVRALDSLDSRRVEGAASAVAPFWSPDSRYIAYFDSAGRRVMKTSIDASVPESVAEIKGNFGGGIWRNDGTILYVDDGQLFQVSAAVGAPQKVTLSGIGKGFRSVGLRLLPDGRNILHLLVVDGGKTELRVTDLENGRSKTLASSVSSADYDSGHLIYVREGALMARPFDPSRLEFTGDPYRIEAAVEATANGRRAMFGVSGNGVLGFRRPSGTVESLSWFSRDGRELGPMQQSALVGNHHEVSPDGRRVAFGSSTSNSENGDLWITDIERGVNSRLTSHPALDWVAAWSPDSQRLAFTSNRNSAAGSYQLYVIDVDTPGSEKPLVVDVKSKHHMAWSPNGKQIVYEAEGSGLYDLWVAPVDGSGKPAPLIATEFSENQPAFSPDGRWLGYISNRTGRNEVYVREFAGGPAAAVVQVSTNGGIQPRWRKDGKEILYLAADGHIMSVPIQSATAAFVPGNPARLFRTELLGVRAATHFTMTADGERFLLPSVGTGIRQEPYIFLVNWLPRPDGGR